MASIGTGYDLSSTTFSPDGRVFQIDYAAKAVDNSGTVLGLRCTDGVVLAVEKAIVSKMLVPGTLRRAHLIDTHVTMVICGLLPDGRVIVDHAREECERYREFYNRDIPARVLADRLAQYVHLYTLHWHLRPFGCAILLAVHGEGEDADMPQLYLIEPSGVCYRYYAVAFGKGKQAARTELEKLDMNDAHGRPKMTCEQAVKALANILVRVHDDTKDKDYDIEMSWVKRSADKRAAMVPKSVVKAAYDEAKAKMEADEMGDD